MTIKEKIYNEINEVKKDTGKYDYYYDWKIDEKIANMLIKYKHKLSYFDYQDLWAKLVYNLDDEEADRFCDDSYSNLIEGFSYYKGTCMNLQHQENYFEYMKCLYVCYY